MIFEIAIGTVLFLLLTVIVGVALYDVDEIRKQHDYKKHPRKKIYTNKPFISVLITSSGDVSSLQRCIESVLKNNYKKSEVIVVCHGELYHVRKLLRSYPRVMLSNNKKGGIQAIRSAYKRHGHGDLSLLLTETNSIDDAALSHIAWQYNAEGNPDIMILNKRVVSRFSMAGLFTTYYLLLLQLFKKMKCAFQTNYSLHTSGSVMTKNTLLTGLSHSSYFISNIYVSSYTSRNLGRFTKQPTDVYHGHYLQKITLGFVRIVTWLVLLIIVNYFLYVAVMLHQPTLLLLSVTCLGMMILFGIYVDVKLSFREKITYSLLSPVTYVLFYILSYVKLFSEIEMMIPIKRRH